MKRVTWTILVVAGCAGGGRATPPEEPAPPGLAPSPSRVVEQPGKRVFVPPMVQIGDPEGAGQHESSIYRTVVDQMDVLKRCYRALLRKDAALEGTVRATFTIAPSADRGDGPDRLLRA